MEVILYSILLFYFLIGAIAFIIINRKLDRRDTWQNWLKFLTYFIIVNLMFLAIISEGPYYTYVSVGIVTIAFCEIILNIIRTKKYLAGFSGLFILIIIGYAFIRFSFQSMDIILTVLFLTLTFDAFSQISGQLFGKRKLISSISPNKTIGGLIGGIIMSLLSMLFLYRMLNLALAVALVLAAGVALFAFTGDILASLLKRKLGIKDFSKLLPGQGGFLDRFDSLLFSSAFIYIILQAEQNWDLW